MEIEKIRCFKGEIDCMILTSENAWCIFPAAQSERILVDATQALRFGASELARHTLHPTEKTLEYARYLQDIFSFREVK